MQLTQPRFEWARPCRQTPARSLEAARFRDHFEARPPPYWRRWRRFKIRMGAWAQVGTRCAIAWQFRHLPDDCISAYAIVVNTRLRQTGLRYRLNHYDPQTVSWRTIPRRRLRVPMRPGGVTQRTPATNLGSIHRRNLGLSVWRADEDQLL